MLCQAHSEKGFGRTGVIVIIFVVVIIGIVAIALNTSPPPVKTETILGIEQIFYNKSRMDDSPNYDVIVRQQGNRLVMKHFLRCSSEAVLIADVPTDRSMWAKTWFHEESGITIYDKIEFHLHSASDIAGGEVDYGKFGKTRINTLK